MHNSLAARARHRPRQIGSRDANIRADIEHFLWPKSERIGEQELLHRERLAWLGRAGHGILLAIKRTRGGEAAVNQWRGIIVEFALKPGDFGNYLLRG